MAPQLVAHQKIEALAPLLTEARAEHGMGDLVLFDTDGVVIAFAGGDVSPVDAQTQARAESLAAIGQRLLALSRGADHIKRELAQHPVDPAGPGPVRAMPVAAEVAELITIKYRTPEPQEEGGRGQEWPVVVFPIAGTLGLVGDIPPRQEAAAGTLPRLGHALATLADALRTHPELRPLVAGAS